MLAEHFENLKRLTHCLESFFLNKFQDSFLIARWSLIMELIYFAHFDLDFFVDGQCNFETFSNKLLILVLLI